MCASIIWKNSLDGTFTMLVKWRHHGEWEEHKIRRQIWILTQPLTGNNALSFLSLSFFNCERGIVIIATLPTLLWSGFSTSHHPGKVPRVSTGHRVAHPPACLVNLEGWSLSLYFLTRSIKLLRHRYVHTRIPINYLGLSPQRLRASHSEEPKKSNYL